MEIDDVDGDGDGTADRGSPRGPAAGPARHRAACLPPHRGPDRRWRGRRGRLLVAATDRGICFVSLGATDAPLEKALAAEFPAATLRRDEAALGAELAALVAYLEGAEPPTALPLDIRCTAFQRRVWEELRSIPMGETRTYREIAERLGQ